ncbi:MAG TPA: hypothetical protein VJV78_16760 [Polyangiales bacterium]|nr:hypothetical protein [Polyangiales bacterium]
MKWIVFTLCCALPAARVLAAPFELAPVSNGTVNTRFVQLSDGKLLLLWTGGDAVTWTQRLDAASGALVGEAARAGQLNAREVSTVNEPRSDAEPRVLALPEGDVALIGLLADGRFTFARGSEVPARRVAARVLLPKPERTSRVQGFAATASAQGFLLAILRAIPAPVGPQIQSEIELHAFGPRGEVLREPLRWQTELGSSPQLGVCGGVTYLVWRGLLSGLNVATFSSAFERSPETSLRDKRGQAVRLGLWCQDSGAQLLGGIIPTFSEVQRVAPQLRMLPLTAAGIASGTSWRSLRLPGVPRANAVDQLALLATPEGPALLLARGRETARVGLDLSSFELTSRQTGARGESCMPLTAAAGWVCAQARTKGPKACRELRTQLSLEWSGIEPPQPAAAGSADDFWAAPSSDTISNLDAPSAAQATRDARRVTCGTKDWLPLREALSRWCKGPGPDQVEDRRSFCDANGSSSLLFQATRCSTAPLPCAGSSRDDPPYVSRDAYELGEDLEFGFMRCWVHFARSAGEWAVTRSECREDEPMD